MIPNYLYKFEKISEQTLRNLKNAQIFFNTPSSFNDPFDCSVLEASVELAPKDYISIFNHYIRKKGILLDYNIRDISDIPEKHKDQILSGLQQSLEKAMKVTYSDTFPSVNSTRLIINNQDFDRA